MTRPHLLATPCLDEAVQNNRFIQTRWFRGVTDAVKSPTMHVYQASCCSAYFCDRCKGGQSQSVMCRMGNLVNPTLRFSKSLAQFSKSYAPI